MHIAGAAQSYTHQGHRQDSEGIHNRWEQKPLTRVEDRMTSSITVVSPETRLGEVLHLFTIMNLNAVAVYDAREYVGLIGYSLLKEAMRNDSHHVRVRDVMDTREIRIDPCSPDELLSDAWNRMRQTGQTNLPVLDAQGKLVGVLSAPGMNERFLSFEPSKRWKQPNRKTANW